MANDGIDVAASESKRAEKTKRVFVNAAGEKSPRAKLDSVAGEVTLVSSGEQLHFALSDLKPEVINAAALFGIMTSITNAIGKAGMSDDEMWEAITARWETIEGGQWSGERTTGPKDSDILEAARRYQEESGRVFDEAAQAKMRAMLADEAGGADYRKRLLSAPRFKAHFEAIKAERAAQRAAKARANIGTAPDADLMDL